MAMNMGTGAVAVELRWTERFLGLDPIKQLSSLSMELSILHAVKKFIFKLNIIKNDLWVVCLSCCRLQSITQHLPVQLAKAFVSMPAADLITRGAEGGARSGIDKRGVLWCLPLSSCK